MGALMRGHDWARTPFGAPETWPQSLRTMVAVCLNSPMLGAVLWGPELRILYNDGYIPSMADHHPAALGQPVAAVWGAAWDGIAALLHRAVETGEGFSRLGVALQLTRNGRPETTYWDFTAAPIRGEDGVVVGLFNQGVETTERVLAEREAALEQERQRGVLQQMPGFVAILEGPAHTYTYVNDAYVAISGGRPLLGLTVREAFPELEGQGFYELLDGAYATGTPVVARDVPIMLAGNDQRYIDMLYHPVRDRHDRVQGIFVGGYDVTAAVRTQAALQAERDRLASVLDGMAEGFMLLAPDFTILDINKEALRLEHRTREAIVGETYWRINPGAEESDLGRLYQRAMDERVPVELEHHFTWPAGHAAWIRMRAFPVPEGLAVFYRDVSSRHDADEKLRIESERVRMALNAGAIAGTWVWDIAADRVTADERFAACFGLDPELCRAGLPIERFMTPVHDDDRPRLAAAIAEAMGRGGPYRCEYRVRDASGDYRWIEANGFVELGPDGAALRFPGVLLDIQERRAVEDERDRAAGLLRTLAEAVPGVVYAKDREGRLLVANRGTTELIGKPPEFYIGKTDFEVLDDKAQALAIMATDQRIMTTEQPEQVEELVDYPDGSRVVWLSSKAPLRNAAGEVIGLIGSSIDITARKQAEAALSELNETLEQRVDAAIAELRQAEETLRQSQKMEAVGQLTGGIAHDFNNMLAVVIGSLELLERRVGLADARAKRYLDAAADGARRAALLTQRLLAFSRQQPLRPEPTDINRLVAGMSDLLRHALGAAVELEAVLAGGLWRGFVDPNQLENVILNLAVNARDAMRQGGRLTIETQNAHLDARYVAPHIGIPAGQYVLIAVTDTGCGMTPEVIAKAFDPFFTTKEVGKGTGLGLSQVYGFVKQSGGHVKIYSEPGEGTTVKVYLPRHQAGAGEAADDPGDRGLPLGESQEVVLVVEDEPTVRQFSVDALSELGYHVIEADGAAAALQLLEQHPEIALMFTDVVMPQVNGAKLAQAALRLRPDLKVLFTTGYTRNAVVHNGVLDAGVELIGKPFTIDELAAKVRAVLDAPDPN